MKNPAREKFLPLLSPYVDGELSPEERQLVEQHLAHNRESAAQVADFRAGDALMRHALEMQGDEVDWKAFTEGVMGQLTPEKLPFFARLKLTLGELFTYQRGPMVAAMVGAAAAIAIAVPVALKVAAGLPTGYGADRVEVQTVAIEGNAPVRPVVMETDDGDAVIWVVEDGQDKTDGGKKKRKGDTGGEEELNQEPEKRQGDL
jgi:anti-sigma factor RsiW